MIDTNVKLDLRVNCLNCPNLDILDNTQRFYSGGNVPELVLGNITCTHHLICPDILGKEKISELLSKMVDS